MTSTSGDESTASLPQTGEGRCFLPQTLDLTAARELRERLAALLTGGAILLDVSAVERMSTPCMQVLVAAGRSAEWTNVSFRIVNASDTFRAAVSDLGLETQFCKWMA